MFWTIARFEIAYQLRRPVTYLYVVVFFLLAFAFTSSDIIQIGGGGAAGQVKENSPFVIGFMMVVLAAVGQVFLTAVVGTAILRDFQYRTHELLFTTPLSRGAYLGGRFVGALVVMIVIHLAMPLGAFVGALMPWVDKEKLLAFSFLTYVHPFVTLVLPGVFLISAIFFSVGALSRSLFAIYTQGIFLLVAYSITGALVQNLDNERVASLVDPFAITAIDRVTRYWTVAEKNSQTVPWTGYLLENRLLWGAIAVGLLAMTFGLFRFRSAAPSLARRRRLRETTSATPAAIHPPVVSQRFGRAAAWRQFLSTCALSFRSVTREIPFLAIVTIGMVNLAMTSWYADSLYGETVWPVTYTMVETLDAAFLLFFIVLITIYAGEAVWRERQLGADQLADALPTHSAVTLLGKLAALVLVEALLLALLIVVGVVIQTIKGYTNYELGLYLRFLYGTTFPYLIMLTVLAFLIHTLVNQKFVGHVTMIVFYASTLVLSQLGIEHQLAHYATAPSFTYSDMNGFGPFVPNIVWSIVYGSGLAALLVVLAYRYWIRGTEDRFALRRRLAASRGSRTVRVLTSAAVGVALVGGAAIFYNTNVRNRYETDRSRRKMRAAYERKYKVLEKVPQPRLVDAKVRADLVPEEGAFTVSGWLTYVNRHARALDTLILTTQVPPDQITIDTLGWDRAATAILTDSVHGTRLFRLGQPLASGDSLRLRYRAHYRRRGFGNDGLNTDVVPNGTFVNSGYFPALGYQEGGEIASDDDRRKEKLPPKERMPSINDEAARVNTYLANDSDWITFEATVSTAPDQIAIAPGYLVREYRENGRRVFEYKMDRPILNFFSFLSARYHVKRETWNGINLEIYYHPGHEYNLTRMMDAMKESIAYNAAHFSPYQFRQVRIIEFPRYATFAQAFPNTVPYSESVGFILRSRDKPDDLDMPYFVTAHEVGHQWWAHQVIGANMQGSTMLSEGLAEYSALTAMEKKYGREQAKKFLEYELDRYLAGRATEQKKELPLMLVENQPYIHYNKGSLALYALRDYIGEDSLNAALSRFLKDKAFQQAPFTTSREFLGYLRQVTADSLEPVLTDLFETITLWDNRAEDAEVTRRGDGKYVVTLTVKSLKLRADSVGNETEVPMRDLVDVGVFGEKEKGESIGKPLYLAKRRVSTGTSTIEVVVDSEPRKAGIDPYNKLIDRVPKDNVRDVRRSKAAG